MQAVEIDNFGPSSTLELREVEKPEIKPAQILVEVHAAGVNPIDWKIREGWMKERHGENFPMRLGFDVSGVVTETGSDVNEFEVGDEVFARSTNGAGKCYAEFVAIDANIAALKPAQLSHIEAGAMPLAALTALNGLRGLGNVQPGHRVLIVGASGGVGLYAIQIAKNIGAHVTAVCSARNIDIVKEVGADDVIDYTTADPLAADQPYDLIYDAVGVLVYAEAREKLTDHGVYMTLSPVDNTEFFFPGQSQRVDKGGYFLIWTATGADMRILANWVEQDSLRSVIDSEYTLDQIVEAHERSQTERARGKIVVRVKH